MKRWLAVILFLMCWTFGGMRVSATQEELFIDDGVQRLYTSEDGLLSTSSTAIAQTTDGYIWIGGYGGLVRYDGNQFLPYETGELSNIKALLPDPDGGLWIASADAGLVYLKDNAYTYLPGAEDLSVSCMTMSADGTMYFGTGSGFGMVSAEGVLSLADAPALQDVYVNRILSDRAGRVLCVTREGGLFLWEEDELRTVDLGDYSLEVRSIFFDGQTDTYYIGTLQNTLLRCDGELNVLDTFEAEELDCINDIFCDPSGVVWLCSDSGIGAFKEGTLRLQSLDMNNSVDLMMQDMEGSYWFVSSRQGVLEVSKSRFGNVSQSAGLDQLVVNAVTRLKDRLYIGHDEGLVILDAESYRVIEDPAFAPLSSVRIRSLCVDGEDNLWVATKGKGLVKIPQKGEWTYYDSDAFPQIVSNNFRCIYEKDGLVAAGTDAGAYLIQGDEVTSITDPSEGFSRRVLSIGREGDTWYLGTDGYGLYAVQKGKITRKLTTQNGLSSDVIMKIYADEEKNGIWMVTGNSLTWMEEEKDPEKIPFPSTNNLDFLMIPGGEVWIPAGNGIYQTTQEDLLREEGNPRLYRHIDGVPYEVTANSNQYLDGDTLYICGSSGLMSVKTNEDDQELLDYKLTVDQVQADAETIYTGNLDEITLQAGVQRIDIGAHVLTYQANNPQVFYYLEGFDSEPTKVALSEHPRISYTNLEGGQYVFRFGIMRYEDGEILKERSLVIHKKYQWYELKLVKGLLAALLILLVVLLTLLAVRRHNRGKVRKLREEYERKEKVHLEEIAYKDYLTGLYNRNYLEIWEERVQAAYGYPVTFVTIDLNNLKLVNDRYGHKQGDELLKEMANLLTQAFSMKEACVIRFGGDEFLVLCCGYTQEKVRQIMNRLQIEALSHKVQSVEVSFSYGICSMEEDAYDFEEGLRRSDLAMLEAKDRFHGREESR